MTNPLRRDWWLGEIGLVVLSLLGYELASAFPGTALVLGLTALLGIAAIIAVLLFALRR